MSRPDPIQYAERLYAAIRDANFSPISFLSFGNAVKDGVPMRNMPRIAVEPFMRVVGEMLDLEEATAGDDLIEAAVIPSESLTAPPASAEPPSSSEEEVAAFQPALAPPTSTTPDQRRTGGKRGGGQKAP